MNNVSTFTLYCPKDIEIPLDAAVFWRKKNTRSQAKIRREVRWRSNLPKSIQKRLGFKVR